MRVGRRRAPQLLVWPLLTLLAIAASLAIVEGAAGRTDLVASQPSNETVPPCERLELVDREARGGCVVETRAERVRLTVLSSLGGMQFATCGVGMTLHFGPRGRVAVADVTITSLKGPCADAVACLGRTGPDGELNRLPWIGEIHGDGDGDLRLAVDACLDTCIGRFEGRLTWSLVRAERTWRLRADRAPIGESGFVWDGEWRFRGEAVDLREVSAQ
jgi:hypothetical protein